MHSFVPTIFDYTFVFLKKSLYDESRNVKQISRLPLSGYLYDLLNPQTLFLVYKSIGCKVSKVSFLVFLHSSSILLRRETLEYTRICTSAFAVCKRNYIPMTVETNLHNLNARMCTRMLRVYVLVCTYNTYDIRVFCWYRCAIFHVAPSWNYVSLQSRTRECAQKAVVRSIRPSAHHCFVRYIHDS